eukprot:33098_1
MKKEEVTTKDLYEVAKNISILSNDTAVKLSTYLHVRMIDDTRKARPWICWKCEFLNRKLMVHRLWRYYNQANACGLCGEPRTEIGNETKKDDADKIISSANNPPYIDHEKW